MSTWDSEEPDAAANANKSNEEDKHDVKNDWEENDEDSEEESEDEPVVAVEAKKKSVKQTQVEKEKDSSEGENTKTADTAVGVDKVEQPGTDISKSTDAVGQIDQFEPTSKEQFDKFGELLKEKITKYESSSFYVTFLECLLRDASTNLEADDVKKILSTVNAVSNEKVKQQKAAKGKKKPKKATLVVGKDTVKEEIGGDADYDDFDDYV